MTFDREEARADPSLTERFSLFLLFSLSPSLSLSLASIVEECAVLIVFIR